MDCHEVFKCLFNIGQRETQLYKALLKNTHKIDELVKILGKDRSTIQRCLSKLMACELVKRKKRTIKEGGGHYYVYMSIPPQELRQWLNKCIEKWHKEMNKAVEDLEDFI